MNGLTLSLLHLHLQFAFEFEFPAKNSEFFRFKYLNFPPTFLDSIAGGGGGAGAGHGDNRGTSCIAALNQYIYIYFKKSSLEEDILLTKH